MGSRIVTIKEIAAEVYECGQYLKANFSPADLREHGQHSDDPVGTDCRLQIHDGTWYFHSGEASYDQDHRGSWGSGFVPRGVSKMEARRIAKDLIAEAMSDYHEEDN